MATLPELQQQLLKIADKLPTSTLVERMVIAQRIREIVEEMYRRKPFRRAPPVSRSVTPAMKKQIRAYADLHPDATQQDISIQFGVIAARVSEALRGKRR